MRCQLPRRKCPRAKPLDHGAADRIRQRRERCGRPTFNHVRTISQAGQLSQVITSNEPHAQDGAERRVTETVYRKELRPVLRRGAAAMDSLFPRDTPDVGKQIGKQEGTELAACPPNNGGEGT